MPLDPDRPFDLATAILDAVIGAFEDDGVSLPDLRFVSAGPPVDDCELVAVHLQSMTPSEVNATTDFLEPNPRGVGFAVRTGEYVVTIIRCTPERVVRRGGRWVAPSAEAREDTSEVLYADSIRVVNAVSAAQRAGELAGCNELAFGNWVVVGPSGGHVGGATTLRVALTRG